MHSALQSGHSIYFSQTSAVASHTLTDTPDDFEINNLKCNLSSCKKKQKKTESTNLLCCKAKYNTVCILARLTDVRVSLMMTTQDKLLAC